MDANALYYIIIKTKRNVYKQKQQQNIIITKNRRIMIQQLQGSNVGLEKTKHINHKYLTLNNLE